MPSNFSVSFCTRAEKFLMELVVVHLMDIHWMYSSSISESDLLVEAESSMDFKMHYSLRCSSTVNRALVLASMTLKNLSLSNESSYGWIVDSASVKVPVTFS